MSGFVAACYGSALAVLGACFGVGCATRNDVLVGASAVAIVLALYIGATK